MKALAIVVAAFGAFSATQSAEAQCQHQYRERHCRACIKVMDTWRWEQREVKHCEQVIVGYRDEVVGYEDVTTGYEDQVVGYQDEIVGYEDVWVSQPVTVYENRLVNRQVLVGYDCCGRPIYRCRQVCEQVPVTRYQRVCEKKPIVQKRPICEKRPTCEKRPICEKRPVYENRETSTCEWVRVPQALYVCFR